MGWFYFHGGDISADFFFNWCFLRVSYWMFWIHCTGTNLVWGNLQRELIKYCGIEDDTTFISSLIGNWKHSHSIFAPLSKEEFIVVFSEIVRRYEFKRLSWLKKTNSSVELDNEYYPNWTHASIGKTIEVNWKVFLKRDTVKYAFELEWELKVTLIPVFALRERRTVRFQKCDYVFPTDINTTEVFHSIWRSNIFPTILVEKEYGNYIRVGNHVYSKIALSQYWYKYSDELWTYSRNFKDSIERKDWYSSYHTDHETIVVRAEKWSEMFFWIEFEKSYAIDFSQSEIHDKNDNWWRIETDSTVWAEYISPVLSLDKYEDSIEFIKSTAQEILDAEVDRRCGWHIHVSVKWIKEEELYRLCAPFMPLLWSIYPERASNSYSERPRVGDNALLSCRRRDFQIKSSIRTVEFRIFPWCRWENMLRFRLSLLNIIVKKAISSRTPMSFSDALDFIMNSEEIFDKLTYVYNTTDKMKGISQRIRWSYESVIWTEVSQDVSLQLFNSLQNFVNSKSKELNNPILESEDY